MDSGGKMGRVITQLAVGISRVIWLWVLLFLSLMVRLMLLSVIGIHRGIVIATHEIAAEWSSRAVEGGMPVQHEPQLYWINRILAVIFLVLGWVCLAWFTVLLLSLMF